METQEIRRIAQAMLKNRATAIKEVPLVSYLSSFDMMAVSVMWNGLEVRKIIKYQPRFLGTDELKQKIEESKLEAIMDLLAAVASESGDAK